jgi:AcrR family transcriptional regulator
MTSASVTEPNRFERRKAQTRSRISEAADRLFRERGYAQTSVEDIAREADVAVRTIYLHFESKAAILLAYVDDWLDAFVVAFTRRPIDEPLADAVGAALDEVVGSGWKDQPIGEMTEPHPVVAFLAQGGSEVAGHILQAWLRAQDRMVAADLARLSGPDALLVARTRAAAVFASWVGALMLVRDGLGAGTLAPEATGNTLGLAIIRGLRDV